MVVGFVFLSRFSYKLFIPPADTVNSHNEPPNMRCKDHGPPLSNGNEPDALGRVASHMMDGQAEFLVGSMTVVVDGAPLQRLTSMTGQNCMEKSLNTPGTCVIPSQFCVLVLS
jgi:hypothetical protein